MNYEVQKIKITDLENKLFNWIVGEISNIDLDYFDGEAWQEFSFQYPGSDIQIEIEGTLSVSEYKGEYSASIYNPVMYITIEDNQVEASFIRGENGEIENTDIDEFLNDVESAIITIFKRK